MVNTRGLNRLLLFTDPPISCAEEYVAGRPTAFLPYLHTTTHRQVSQQILTVRLTTNDCMDYAFGDTAWRDNCFQRRCVTGDAADCGCRAFSNAAMFTFGCLRLYLPASAIAASYLACIAYCCILTIRHFRASPPRRCSGLVCILNLVNSQQAGGTTAGNDGLARLS